MNDEPMNSQPSIPLAERPTWFRDSTGRPRLGVRLFLGTMTVVLGLVLAMLAGQVATWWFDELPGLTLQAIYALVMSATVVPLICLLRLRADQQPLAGIGLARPLRAGGFFLLGFSIPAAVIILPVLIVVLVDLGSITVNLTPSQLGVLIAWLVLALLFEAFPEELAIRGYLYRNLSAAMTRWLAALASIALFLSIPLILALLQQLTGLGEPSYGGHDRITVGYLMLIVLLGAILAYTRVVTGSVWVCIGLHLGFLQLGRGGWIGDHDGVLIQIDTANPAQVDLVFQLAALVALLVILFYPWLSGRKPRWREKGSDGGREN